MAVGAEQAAGDIGGADGVDADGSAGGDADDREGVAIDIAVEACGVRCRFESRHWRR
jgi:hypothetical protein